MSENSFNWELDSNKPYRVPLERAVSLVSPEKVIPGMIYVRRAFNAEKVTINPEVGLYGTGGHMGLIVGVREEQVWILSATDLCEKPREEIGISPATAGSAVDFFFRHRICVLFSTEGLRLKPTNLKTKRWAE